MRDRLAEIWRFALVGFVATATHVAVGLSLAELLDWPPWAANIVAFIAAMVLSYIGNTIVTFRVEARRAGAFARFAAVSIGAFALNQSIVTLLTGTYQWSYAASLAVVVCVVPVLTYLLSKYWALASARRA